MRVCWIIDSLGPGGAEALVPRFVRACAGAHLEADVVVLRRADDEPRLDALRALGAPVTVLGARNLRDLAAFRRLQRHLRGRRPDVIHAHLTYATIWSAVTSILTGVPLVATLHEMPDGRRASFRDRVLRFLVYGLLRRRAGAVIAVSRALARAVIDTNRLPADLLHVIPNAAPEPGDGPKPDVRQRLRRELGIPETAPLAISVAVLRPDKGLDVAVRAMASVIREVPDARLLIVGSGPGSETLRQLAATSGVEDRCVFAGRREDVDDLYPIADLLVHPSRREALPTVILEGMAAGLPVVATDVGGSSELVAPGVNGLLVPADSSDALAEAVVGLLRNPPRARALGRAGQRMVGTRLGPTVWVERLSAVYRAAARSSSSRFQILSTRTSR